MKTKTAKIEKTTQEKMGELFEGAFRSLPLWTMIPTGETIIMVQTAGQVVGYSADLTEEDGIDLASLLLGFFAPLGGDYHSLKEGTDLGALTDNFIEVVKAERAAEEEPPEAPPRWAGGWAAAGNREEGKVLLARYPGCAGPMTPLEARQLADDLYQHADFADNKPLPDPREEEGAGEEEGGPGGDV